MKNKVKSVVSFGLVAVLAIAALIFFAPITAEETHAQTAAADAPTVNVSGTGSITVVPDIATVTLGVETRSGTAQNAIEQNNTTMSNVLTALSAMGINDADISTNNFWLHQNWNWTMDGNHTPDGYTVSNTLSITIRDLDNIGAIIGAAVNAGANVSHGIQFSIEDASAVYLQALALAVQDASAKANAIASALGNSITSVISVTETNTWAAPTSWGDFDMGMMRTEALSDAAASVPIQASDLTITARVNVIYALSR